MGEGKIIEQVSIFKNFSCEIFYRNNGDMEEKLDTFCFFCGTIHHMSGKTVCKEMFILSLLLGCETWIALTSRPHKKNTSS
jgi:hypothetical protein